MLLHFSRCGLSSGDSDGVDVGGVIPCCCTYEEGTHPI